jgi:hypothetical protein
LVFSLNTIKELRSLAREAGLRHIRVRFEHRTLRYPVPAGLGAGFMGETPMAAQFAALGDDQKQAFVAHAVEFPSGEGRLAVGGVRVRDVAWNWS